MDVGNGPRFVHAVVVERGEINLLQRRDGLG